MSLHPSAEILALFSSADLPLLDRLKIRKHVSRCEYCQRQLALLRESITELHRQARTETLTSFEAVADWARLEREMQGNIAVGVSAARCIGIAKKPHNIILKFGLASGMAILFVLGWMTHVPPEQSSKIYASLHRAFSSKVRYKSHGSILRSQPGGIMVGSPEGSLTLLHPASAVVSASGASSVEARYSDDETGQVTITSVYAQ